MCLYCDKNKKDNLVPSDGIWTSIDMLYDQQFSGNWFLEAWGDDCARVQIYYCPFCGRKLEIELDKKER